MNGMRTGMWNDEELIWGKCFTLTGYRGNEAQFGYKVKSSYNTLENNGFEHIPRVHSFMITWIRKDY
jgi:hypothetical protein